MTRPLRESEVVTGEMVLGMFSLRGLGSPPELDVPTKGWLLHGSVLVAPPPAGDQVDDAATARATADELAALLGGPFVADTDLAGHVVLVDSLASKATRDMYAGGGMHVRWDRPRRAFSWLTVALDGWRAQALGDVHDFHAVTLLHDLAPDVALDPRGGPVPRPLGPVTELLADLAPAVAATAWSDRSADFEPNLFDTVLEGDGVRVRSGVRQVWTGDGPEPGAPARYAYAVRLDLDPARIPPGTRRRR